MIKCKFEDLFYINISNGIDFTKHNDNFEEKKTICNDSVGMYKLLMINNSQFVLTTNKNNDKVEKQDY